jgi:hypothetical protein
VTSLARCVGDDDRFLAEHWGRAPLHLRGIDAEGFADLLSLGDVDQLISSSFLRLPAIRLVRDGTPLDSATYTRSARLGNKEVADVADPGRVYERFGEGATIVLQGLQRFWEPLTRFCRELELELTHPVQVNAYITPPAAQALAVHYDTHDVFVLQFAGSKQWSIHEPVLEDPLASQPWSSSRGRPGDPILAASLATGDSLYVPRGFLHSALAQEGTSAHLTIGVVATTWADLLRTAIAGIDDEVDFRRALPVGFAHEPGFLAPAVAAHLEQLRAWLEKVDVDAVAERAARRFWSGRTPMLAGQLHQLSLLDDIHDGSRVRRRPGTICRVHLDVDAHGDRVHVLLGNRELHMPGRLEPAVRRLADAHDGMAVGALADQLDGPSRLVLVRRLVREGLLEVVDVG